MSAASPGRWLAAVATAVATGATGAAPPPVGSPKPAPPAFNSPHAAVRAAWHPATSLLRGQLRRQAKRQGGNNFNHLVRPTVCKDAPENWKDSMGHTCSDYIDGGFCTDQRDEGPNWQEAWGTLKSYANQGYWASSACCACGGGSRRYAPTCEQFNCPDGFSMKTGNDMRFCKGFDCDIDHDIVTCCEANPEVQATIVELQTLTAQLAEDARQRIVAAGAAEFASVNSSAVALADELLRKSRRGGAVEALQATKQHFANLTQNEENLGDSAEYQIKMSGYVAARNAAFQDLQVDSEKLQAAIRRSTQAFVKAEESWQNADAVSNEVVQKGQLEWDAYHADLNATWPALVEGIRGVSGAIKESAVPAQAVRWSEQATRLAVDFAQVVDTQAKSMDAIASAAQDQAAAALVTTQGNAGKIGELEDMVSRISQQ